MNDDEFVETLYRRSLLREADPGGRQHYVAALTSGLSRLEVVQRIVTSPEFFDLLSQQRFGPETGSPLLKAVPPGHFYSPIPSLQAVEALAAEPESYDAGSCPGIALRVDEQLGTLRELAPLVSGLTIPDLPSPGCRYYADNGSFAPGDALLLAAMMLWAKPRVVLEVGAGFSTALMLDVVDVASMGGVSLARGCRSGGHSIALASATW